MNAKDARRITEQAQSYVIQLVLERIKIEASKGFNQLVLDDFSMLKLNNSDIKSLEKLGYTVVPRDYITYGREKWYTFPVIKW